MKKHLLFICSSNIDRSKAAEELFKKSNKFSAESAGTHTDSIKRVDQKMIDKADIIFVMSEGTNKHLSYLKNNFDIKNKEIHDLHVRDIYFKNDPRLKRLLVERVSKIIKSPVY